MPRIVVYLAGPAVFRRDAAAHGERLKALCAARGLHPLWPLDNAAHGAPAAMARMLVEKNCAMIRAAAAVIADISPFRGPNMDPGTAFEIGFASALDKPVFLYSASRHTLFQRTAANFDLEQNESGKFFDVDNMEVEDFDLAENLMIAGSGVTIHDDVDAAITACARHFATSHHR